MDKETVAPSAEERLKQIKQTQALVENLPNDQQPQKKISRPSLRWLVSELDRITEKNSELAKQLELQKALTKTSIEAKSRLEREFALLRSRGVVGAHENDAIRERNKQLSQDVFLMKSILVKLNFELERYQDKLRKYENSPMKIDIDNYRAHKNPIHKTEWINGEITIMAPLMIAYEESLKEKDDLINDFRENMDRLTGKMKEVVRENSELGSKINESEMQGEVNYSDWMRLRRELTITAEQNQLLSRQTKLAQSKIADLKAAFQIHLNEVCSERDEAISKLSLTRTDYLVLKGRNSALEEEYQRLKEDSAERIPKSVHSSYIAECKGLLNELKHRYAEERNALLKKIADLEDVEHAKHPSSMIIDELKEIEVRLADSEERRLKCERKREAMKERMDGLVQFSKELILEHESLLKGVNGELCLNANFSSRIDMIKRQLKGVELETLEQIKMLDENITCHVEKVNKVRNEKDLEVLKLKEELQLKDMEIKTLMIAAKDREKEMKLVWEAVILDKKSSTEL